MSGISIPSRWATRECPNSWSSTQAKSATIKATVASAPTRLPAPWYPTKANVYTEHTPYLEGPASHDGSFRSLDLRSRLWHQRDE
jgi:hypothetical protein